MGSRWIWVALHWVGCCMWPAIWWGRKAQIYWSNGVYTSFWGVFETHKMWCCKTPHYGNGRWNNWGGLWDVFIWIFNPRSSKLLTTIHIQKLNGKILLLLDAWTSSNQHAFLAIVMYYVTNDGQLGSSLSSSIHSSTNFSCLRGTPYWFLWTSWWTLSREAVWQTMLLYGSVRKVHNVFSFRKKLLIMITNRLLQSLWTMRATVTYLWYLWSNGVRKKVLGFQHGRLACTVCPILSI